MLSFIKGIASKCPGLTMVHSPPDLQVEFYSAALYYGRRYYASNVIK